jgi:DNA-binding GntR family transcriptional regulator
MHAFKVGTLPRRTMADEVAEALRKAILEGRFAPGDRLVEVDIASELDVSRGPVRDAFRHLEEQGLVVIVPHRGARVASLDARDAYEVYTLMAAAEGLAFQLIKHNVARSVIHELRAALDEMRVAAVKDDGTELAKGDLEFTEVLFRHANHSRLQRVWDNLKFQSYLLVRGYVNLLYPSLPSVVDHHERLVLLLETGTADELSAYLREHGERRELRMRSLVGVDGESR